VRKTGYLGLVSTVNVLRLQGEIDFSRRQWLERELGQIERFGPGAITILDLTSVSFADAAFVTALLRLRSRLLEHQPQSYIFIVAPRGKIVLRLIELTNLDRVFKIFEDLSSARRSAEPLREASHRRLEAAEAPSYGAAAAGAS